MRESAISIGFKVLTKDGLKGPFLKSSILKAIEMGQVPLQAKLLNLETGEYTIAAKLVGEELDQDDATADVVEGALADGVKLETAALSPEERAALRVAEMVAQRQAKKASKKKATEPAQPLSLVGEEPPEKKHFVAGEKKSKPAKPKPRLPAGAKTVAKVPISLPQPRKPQPVDALQQLNEVNELTSISGLILLEEGQEPGRPSKSKASKPPKPKKP